MTRQLDSPLFKVRVAGELACFTRPELKVERVSYEVITPSAARGILEAILWKPAIRWEVARIHLLAPVRWASLKRNEVNQTIALGSARRAMQGLARDLQLCIEHHRAQRHTLALRDVDYVIEAGFRITERAGQRDNRVKFREIFERRLARGQCYRMPYLGCREFAARFAPQVEPFEPIPQTRDLGWMLHDIEFRADGRSLPHFFRARMERGIIDVPEFEPGLRAAGESR